MKAEYDVVVVGVGPAGSSTALFASKQGAEILLIEKKRSIGVPVTCGELLSKEANKIINIPEFLIERELTEEIVYRDDLFFNKSSISAFMINRASYDKYLASKAVENGASLLINTRVMGFSKSENSITVYLNQKGKRVQVRCKILVGADGFASHIAKWSGLAEPLGKSGYYATYQYCMGGINVEKENCSEAFIGAPYLIGGFAWILPKKGTIANIGLAIHSSRALNPRLVLEHFIRSSPIASQRCKSAFPLSESSAPIHSAGPLGHIVRDRIVLVGEAAGHVDPLTGEGNFYAVAGGKIAGNICAEALVEEDFSSKKLSEYEKIFDNEFGLKLRNSAKKVNEIMKKQKYKN